MSITQHVYGYSAIWNFPGEDWVMPRTIKIDSTSTATELIINEDGSKAILRGAFTYSPAKSTLGDVIAGSVDSSISYSGQTLLTSEQFSPSVLFSTFAFANYNEKLFLFAADDIFFGSSDKPVDDYARGFKGDDYFTGYGSGENGDYFNGEEGTDFAYLRGHFSEYSITIDNKIIDWINLGQSTLSGLKISDFISSRDGVDYYISVERLHFSDKVLALDINGVAGQAYRLYRAALDRTPDEGGLGGWITLLDQGMSLSEAAGGFVNSVEFSTKYGPLDDRGFINRLYNNVLGRNGEESGVNDWVAWIGQGHTRAEVLTGFSESPENQAKVLGIIQNGIFYRDQVV